MQKALLAVMIASILAISMVSGYSQVSASAVSKGSATASIKSVSVSQDAVATATAQTLDKKSTDNKAVATQVTEQRLVPVQVSSVFDKLARVRVSITNKIKALFKSK